MNNLVLSGTGRITLYCISRKTINRSDTYNIHERSYTNFSMCSKYDKLIGKVNRLVLYCYILGTERKVLPENLSKSFNRRSIYLRIRKIG